MDVKGKMPVVQTNMENMVGNPGSNVNHPHNRKSCNLPEQNLLEAKECVS